MFKLVLEKAGGSEIKLPACVGLQKKQNSRKRPTSASLTTLKPLTVWITTNCGKFFKRWEYQTTFPASENLYAGQEAIDWLLDMEQQTGSKQEKEYVKAVYCHPAYLTYIQSTL